LQQGREGKESEVGEREGKDTGGREEGDLLITCAIIIFQFILNF